MFFDSITTAGDAANQWYWTNKTSLSTFLQEKIQTLLGPTKSPIEAAVTLPELIYANKQALNDDALELAIGLLGVAVQYNFYGLGEGRGQSIIFALKRDLNITPLQGTEWPSTSEDPEAKAELIDNSDTVQGKLDV